MCGVGSAATVCGTLAARLLPTHQIFQVAAVVAIVAAIYMRIFLQETTTHIDHALVLEEPLLKNAAAAQTDEAGEPLPLKKVGVFSKIPLPKDIIRLLQSRYVRLINRSTILLVL